MDNQEPETIELDAISLLDHLSEQSTNLAMCWKITKDNKVIQGFTDYDQNLVIEGVVYKAVTELNATYFILEDISEASLVGGEYNRARVDVFLCRPLSPSSDFLEHILLDSFYFLRTDPLLFQIINSQVEKYFGDCNRNNMVQKLIKKS
jgi:hypothetical protein